MKAARCRAEFVVEAAPMSAQELNEEAIAHLKRVLDANGFVIVPKKPTSEML
jgi:hypothetical protein